MRCGRTNAEHGDALPFLTRGPDAGHSGYRRAREPNGRIAALDGIQRRTIELEGLPQLGKLSRRWHHFFPRRQPPLEMLAAGILLARLVGMRRKSWHGTVEISIARVFRVGRGNHAAGAGCAVAPLFSQSVQSKYLFEYLE